VPHVIAWCGFPGAWLLVAGPPDQAVREAEDNEFEQDAITEAASQIEEPPWVLIVVMLVFCVGTTRLRYHHRQARPAVDD
jgi:hypothetical protein